VTLDGPSSALDGETITLKAIVASSQAGDILGPGQVTFLAGTSVLGTATLSGGVATLSLTLPVGTYVVHAVYDGDASHAGSTSASLSIGVGSVIVSKAGIAVVEADGSRMLLGASYTPKVLAKGLNIAEGVLATNGAPEIVAAPKPGERAPVEVINGDTGAVIARLTPFGRKYSGGIAVTAADLQDDGTSDVIVGRMRGRRTVIKAIDPLTGRTIRTMVAFRRVFHRGLSLSTRDVNGDGTPDIVARSQGRGHRTLVETFDGRTGVQIGGIERLPAGPAAFRSRRS
jgi:hypothetical protein